MLPFLYKRLLLSKAAPLTAYRAMSTAMKQLPNGAYPTMITPFLDDDKKSVDWNTLDILTEWYIRSGVGGIFSVCLSSEMFQLSNEERVAIARRVVEKAGGRVPVIAGATFEGGLEEQARLMNEMGKFVDAVVIITNQIAKMDESDDVWLSNCQKLMEMTENLPLGLYETPVPKARWLTPKMLHWVAGTGRFVFHKDTSLQLDTMLSKMRALQSVPNTPLKFFTAKAQFVSACVDNGGKNLPKRRTIDTINYVSVMGTSLSVEEVAAKSGCILLDSCDASVFLSECQQLFTGPKKYPAS